MLEIRVFPDPILKKPARKIRRGSVKDLAAFVSDMFETMHDAPGVGLAAPQVGRSIRLFIATVGDGDERVFINPQVLERQGYDMGEEGCLSFPGLYGMIERPTHIKIKYHDEHFAEHIEDFEGFPARVVLHENDHLDGILLNDRTSELYMPEPDEEVEGEGGPPGGSAKEEVETL